MAVKHDHPGRPRYTMLFPKGLTFTFVALMEANGVDTRKYLGKGRANANYGKGENATMLTIRKNLKYALGHKQVFLMKGYTAVPDSGDGLGRRGLLYRHADTPFAEALAEAKVRGAEGLNEATAPKATRKARKSTKTSEQLMADAKAILAELVVTIAPTPASIPDAVHNPIVVPVAETAPVTPAAAAPEVSVPIAEPVVPTPAPAAPVAETAPVVPAETAPVAA